MKLNRITAYTVAIISAAGVTGIAWGAMDYLGIRPVFKKELVKLDDRVRVVS